MAVVKLTTANFDQEVLQADRPVLVCLLYTSNKSGELVKRHGRNKKMEEEHPFDPIDPIELYYHS